MEENFIFEIHIIADREDLGGDFISAHEASWENPELPTREELRDSLQNEMLSWLAALKFGIFVDEISEEEE